MKIKNLAIIIILMTIFFIILGAKAYATTGVINDNTVDLLEEPNSKTILEYVYEGDEVEILDHEDGWYRVRAQTEIGRVTGYISEEFVDVDSNTEVGASTTEPEESETNPVDEPETTTENAVETNSAEIVVTNIEEDKQYTLEQEVSVKAMPLISSREKAKVVGNITIIEVINDWAKIENDIESGWIRKNNLLGALTNAETTTQQQPEEQVESTTTDELTTDEQTTETSETEQEETLIVLNKIGYVDAEGLRVRKEPTTDSEEITSLSRNDEVEIIGQTGNWYQINLDGEIGYVSVKYISDTKTPETTSRSGSTLRDATSAETAQSTSETTGSEVVEYAKQYLGYKYVAGGTSPETGFDCSGFTTYIYKHFGISLNRTSKDQIKNGVEVEKSALQLGDLVIFNDNSNTVIGHVGIYIGDGNFIHASNPSEGVKITSLNTSYYQKRYVGARRVI